MYEKISLLYLFVHGRSYGLARFHKLKMHFIHSNINIFIHCTIYHWNNSFSLQSDDVGQCTQPFLFQRPIAINTSLVMCVWVYDGDRAMVFYSQLFPVFAFALLLLFTDIGSVCCLVPYSNDVPDAVGWLSDWGWFL